MNEPVRISRRYSSRGISTVPAILIAAFAGLVTAVLLADWVILDIDHHGPDPVHIKLPFPLVVADLAAFCVPEDALAEFEVPAEVRAQREVVLTAVKRLGEMPDTTFVRVEDGDTLVVIRKERNTLRIEVDADDAVVRCNIPIDGVFEALDAWDWQTLDPGVLLHALHKADGGNLLTVEAEDARIAINKW